MTELEALRAWLRTFPGWDSRLEVDLCDSIPGCTGLFPKGLQELSRREDVLGQLTIRYRWSFTLRRSAAGSSEENARWLIELQKWAAQQSRLGLAPRFGDDPRQEQLRICEGSLVSRQQAGSIGYTALLTADFTKIYRGE